MKTMILDNLYVWYGIPGQYCFSCQSLARIVAFVMGAESIKNDLSFYNLFQKFAVIH